MKELSPFARELQRFADHPSDLVAYRHFCTTALAKAMYGEKIPPAREVARELGRYFAQMKVKDEEFTEVTAS